MTRIKRGYIARRRRTKIRLFASSFRGTHSKLTRTITQCVLGSECPVADGYSRLEESNSH